MPDHVGQLIRVLAPVMRDAGDAAARDVRAAGRRRRPRRRSRVRCGSTAATAAIAAPIAVVTAVRMNRLQRGRRIGQHQFSRLGEKLYDRIELTIVDCRGVTVHQVAERRPGRLRRASRRHGQTLRAGRQLVLGLLDIGDRRHGQHQPFGALSSELFCTFGVDLGDRMTQ